MAKVNMFKSQSNFNVLLFLAWLHFIKEELLQNHVSYGNLAKLEHFLFFCGC